MNQEEMQREVKETVCMSGKSMDSSSIEQDNQVPLLALCFSLGSTMEVVSWTIRTKS